MKTVGYPRFGYTGGIEGLVEGLVLLEVKDGLDNLPKISNGNNIFLTQLSTFSHAINY